MNQNEALNVLVQAVNLAQQKGAYSLQEAALVAQAIQEFTPSQEQAAPTLIEESDSNTEEN